MINFIKVVKHFKKNYPKNINQGGFLLINGQNKLSTT